MGSSNMLKIHFLGKSRIEYDDDLVDDPFGAKAYALICLLVLNENKYLSREKIIGYLWPDSTDDAARYNLRYNLWLIKKSVQHDRNGHGFLHVDKECCAINQEYEFLSDILEIMNFTPSQSDSIESLLLLKEMFQGDFLEGCYFNKCDELNELIIFERINFEKRKVKVLKRLAELYEKSEKFEACLETINNVLEIEPYDEKMVSKLLDIYMACGKRAAAITYYNKFSNQLAGSLGIAPSDELRNKYNDLRTKMCDKKDPLELKKSDADHRPNQPLETSQTRIEFFTHTIKEVPYFWMSSVIEKMVQGVDWELIQGLNYFELLSLGTIQIEILEIDTALDGIQLYEQEIKAVAIVNAFVKLLNLICDTHHLTIHIINSKNLDQPSLGVLKYLKELDIKGLEIDE